MQNAKSEKREKRQWLDLRMLSNSQAQADCCSVVAIATVATVAAVAAIATVVGRLGDVATIVVDGPLHNSADDGSPGGGRTGARGRVVIALIHDHEARS